jgi:hypothetical protein
MARPTWEEKQDDLIDKGMKTAGFTETLNKPFFQLGEKPYYALIPRRDQNDPFDQFVSRELPKFMVGGIYTPEWVKEKRLASAIPAETAPSHVPWKPPPEIFAGSRSTMALNPNFPGSYGLGRTPAIPFFPDESSHAPFAALRTDQSAEKSPSAPAPKGVLPAPSSTVLGMVHEGRTPGILPRENMELIANRGPASGYSYNPPADQMDNYEYGGTFDRGDGKGPRHIWFWKPRVNPQQELIDQAMGELGKYLSNPREYGYGYGMGALKTVTDLVTAMQAGPNAESERALKGAHADLYRAQAGAIPSEMEERSARAKYYGSEAGAARSRPLILSPGQRAFMQSEQTGYPATEIARGLEEKPATTGALERMSEFDKVQFQAAAHLAQNSLDPETQKLAFQKMDDIERKYAMPKLDRKTAQEKLKATGKYTDEQIEEKLNLLGLKPVERLQVER